MFRLQDFLEKVNKDIDILENERMRSDLKETVRDILQSGRKSDDEKQRSCECFYNWVTKEKQLKVTAYEIPSNILPKHCEGILHDVRVFTRHGPDDAVYDGSQEFRSKVARGNCLLKLQEDGTDMWICLIYALKKFTGGLGDDDDRESGDEAVWKQYFTKSVEEAKFVVCTKKANGEAAHLSAVIIHGKIYICAGSKNVHLLFINRDDIQKYSEPRFRIAREVAETVCDALEVMDEDNRDRLLQFLAHSGMTAVFEILHPEHQHVVNLSHLTKPVLQFVTFTSNDLEADPENQLQRIQPHLAIELARLLGLSTVDYDIVEMSDVEDRISQVRRGYHFEGEVFYFIDDSHHVIGLLKKKTSWYIICRAFREKIRTAFSIWIKAGKETFNMELHKKKISRRLSEIRDWLSLSDTAVSKWQILGGEFLTWSIAKLTDSKLNMKDITETFPMTWKTFLEENELSDNIVPY